MKPNYEKLFEISESQGGYFTTRQAEGAGYSRKDVSAQASRNKFTKIAYGIYRLTFYPYTEYEDLIIAVLKSGPAAVVSHDSALSVYRLSDILPGIIHITIPKTRSRRHAGIKYHTCKISDQEITNFNSLPITTVERTITDVIRSGLDNLLIEHAIEQAITQGMVSTDSLTVQANRYGEKTKKELSKFLVRNNSDL